MCPNNESSEVVEFIKTKLLEESKNYDENVNIQDENEDNDDIFNELKNSDTFKNLMDDFDDTKLVLACLIACNENSEEKVSWCFQNAKDTNKLETILFQYQQRKSDNDQQKIKIGEKVIFDAETLPDTLLSSKLQHIWTQFINQTNSLEITDFISFKAMATCLNSLFNNFGVKLDRKFPTELKLGMPNLLECSENELHYITLAIYMFDPEKSLPSLDEVLICQENTPTEEVELICRRAFSDTSGKIYTILCAERMSFETVILVENLIKMKPANLNYKLVFIACSEKNESSHLISTMDQFRRQTINIPKNKEIQKFLLQKLTVQNEFQSNEVFDSMWLKVIRSDKSGNGKSLLADRLYEKDNEVFDCHYILELHQSIIDCTRIVETWIETSEKANKKCFFHLDISSAVQKGQSDLIFSLCVLGGLVDNNGKIWICSKQDMYIVEMTLQSLSPNEEALPFEYLVPSIQCLSPKETQQKLTENSNKSSIICVNEIGIWNHLFDHQMFKSPVFQRPFQYLCLMKDQARNSRLDSFTFNFQIQDDFSNIAVCLEVLLSYCCVQNPSWAELFYFASFLNSQLESSEKSVFCNPDLVSQEFPGMKHFVLKCLLQMSQDFATRSVEISDQSCGIEMSKPEMNFRRCWENSPHPYIFFNHDGHSMSFFGFQLDGTMNLIDERSGKILCKSIMTTNLHQGLERNGVVFNKSFDSKTEEEKIKDLCNILGVKCSENPDNSYEITSDNVMKILAIFLRFKSNIPVVIMGETGSGKTRLVRFMCDLLKGENQSENMLVMKIHGGITEEEIYEEVKKAIKQAEMNKNLGINQTVLFFDEANTTNAIGTIKAVMCDRLLDGVKIPVNIGLQFVAAVNPYREHTEEMVKKLENAGLGYHISAEKTKEKFKKIPLRRLVYRVREIPASLFPLVWDFGTLNSESERKYINQMVRTKCIKIPQPKQNLMIQLLSSCQEYMRTCQDECGFVSLRDVERTLKVFEWFDQKMEPISKKIQAILIDQSIANYDVFTINVVLALGIAYFAKLSKKEDFDQKISHCLNFSPNQSCRTILSACQKIFIDELQLDTNIAKNDALVENIWIMTICIELKIPLFIVGKPGSSKSLAKTILTDVMQGENSYSEIYKQFKEIQMVSFQCSPLATAEGISSTFRQCQKYQKNRDFNKFTSVCVLDEVGLAEDSPKMPLKVLHSLLEEECSNAESDESFKKVNIAFTDQLL